LIFLYQWGIVIFMRFCLNPVARLRQFTSSVAAALLLFFGTGLAVSAWHLARGVDQERMSVAAADLPTAPVGGHLDDGCALCSTPVQPTFAVVLLPLAHEAASSRVVPLEETHLPTSPILLGASGPRAPPAVS